MLASESKTTARKGALAFGTAISALALTDAPVQAAILPLTPSPGALGYVAGYGFGGNISLGSAGGFYQFNDTYGKTLQAGYFQWRNVVFSSPITSGQLFPGGIAIGTSAAGVQTFAFRTPGNQVGWVQMNLGGPGGTITYIAAAWGSVAGEGILAGTLNGINPPAVPEPSDAALAGLAALAAGAVYLRNRRKQTAVTA